MQQPLEPHFHTVKLMILTKEKQLPMLHKILRELQNRNGNKKVKPLKVEFLNHITANCQCKAQFR